MQRIYVISKDGEGRGNEAPSRVHGVNGRNFDAKIHKAVIEKSVQVASLCQNYCSTIFVANCNLKKCSNSTNCFQFLYT